MSIPLELVEAYLRPTTGRVDASFEDPIHDDRPYLVAAGDHRDTYETIVDAVSDRAIGPGDDPLSERRGCLNVQFWLT